MPIVDIDDTSKIDQPFAKVTTIIDSNEASNPPYDMHVEWRKLEE